MSVYFYHILQSFLPITFYLALWNKKISLKEAFLGLSIGIVFAFAAFRIASDFLSVDGLKTVCFITIIFSLVFLSAIFLSRFSVLKIALIAVLFFCFGVYYRVLSEFFPLFNGELLDTVSIISFGFTVFGISIIIFFYIFFRSIAATLPKWVLIALGAISILLMVLNFFGLSALEMMRFRFIETKSLFLSITAILIYYGSFSHYLYVVLTFIALAVYLKNMPVLPEKKSVGSIVYRQVKAKREYIKTSAKCVISAILILSALFLYYDLYASKPPKISKSTILEPIDGKFKIPIKLLEDDDLHRFAYITEDGHKIRFFAINRFKGKTSPVVVFDACMICGDMGYVKNGDELICISCNVRIFLPSVGKAGGCNPIPLIYENDGEYLIIELDEIKTGANFFSEIIKEGGAQ
ncbi:MAG: Fe-S-containing protein [Campylobacteraceae bacterium]|nr:Fe-S-containing protein [Campylobacteraceae bacterium]